MTSRSIGLAGIVFALILDQATKAVVLSIGSANAAWMVSVTSFFNIVLVSNDGISFGLLGGNVPWWALSLAAIVVVAFLLRWLWHEVSSLAAAGLGLIIGGALGNVVDRFLRGAVTDFLDFHANTWHWPAFNLADTAIFCGLAILIVQEGINMQMNTLRRPEPMAPSTQDILLMETSILDYSHPTIVDLIESKNWKHLREEEKAEAIYTFVRDEILFGYNADDNIAASSVLADGYGQCNTKATLFMALLRAVGIPCRIHGFTIDKALQKGAVTGIFYLIAPANILHSWVEVRLAGRWINLEGLILDKAYLSQLQARNADCNGAFCGFGVATLDLKNPGVDWNGGDTYIQREGINRDYGLYDSPDAFYAKVGTNISGWKRWFYIHFIRHMMNDNVQKIRNVTLD